MQVIRTKITRLIVTIAAIAGVLVIQPASAVSRCGNFEMVPMPERVTEIVPFENGEVSAIGSSADNPSVQVLRYFDGSSWTEQPLPPEVDGFAFGPAGGTPDGHAWFLGTRASTVYEIDVALVQVQSGAPVQIDFTTSSVSSTGNPSASGAPVDISASSFSDVWALTAFGDVLHYDGTTWESMDVPNVYSYRIYAKAIYAASPNDVWIVGYGGESRAQYIGYVQHWNGSDWSTVSTPLDGQDPSQFLDIDGSGSNDIWIAGRGIGGVDIMLHWDGSNSGWTQFDASLSYPAMMARIMAMEPGNAWAVPIQSSTLRYWDGSIWSEASGFDFPESAVTISLRDAEKAGLCDAWVVGDYHDGTAYHPWAARLLPGDVEPPPGGVSSIHVETVDVTRVRVSRKSYYGEAVVTVLDSDMNPVSGATVTGDFSGPSNEHQTAETGADGVANFSTGTVDRPEGDWCFAVTDITLSDAVYDDAMNITSSTCEGSGGTNGKGKGKK